MYSLKKIIVLPLVLICLIISSSTVAKEELSSMEYELQIYQDPYGAYQELLKTPKTIDKKPQYVWWLLRKAQCEYLLYFYEDFEKTIDTLEKHIDKSSPALIQSYIPFYLGVIVRDKGEYGKASQYFDLALEKSKLAGLDYIYVQAKSEKAYTQSLAELFEISLNDIQEAYVKGLRINDQFLIASVNETYGAIYGYMHDYQKSIEYYKKALESYQILGYKAHIAEAIYGMASTYRYWKKYDLAVEYFEKYREVSQFTPNDEISFFAAYGLGMTLSEKGSCEQAVDIIDQALAKKGVIDYKSELYKNKALCLIQLNRIDEAKLAINKAKAIFKELPDLAGTSWQLETIKIESQIAQADQDYILSYQLINDYYQQYTDLLLKNSSDRLLNVRTELEQNRKTIEKDLELQKIQVASLKQQSLQQKQTQQMYFLLFIIVIVVVIVILQQLSNRKMHKLSMTDPLSGLFNRRYIFTYINKLLSTLTPVKDGVILILFDIDDFKTINDKYGHPAGDFVIKKMGEITEKVLRASDVVARIGGEEFLCVLPRTSESQAIEVAQRLLKSVSDYDFNYELNKSFHITISIGIASSNTSNQSYNEIYSQADKALYQAKSKGKNCIIVAEDE